MAKNKHPNTPTDTHNWLLKNWRKPEVSVGTYENDGIQVMNARLNEDGTLSEFWNVPAGIVIIKHELDPDGRHARTVGHIFAPNDPGD